MKTNETKMTVSELREALKASRAKVQLHFTVKGNPAWRVLFRYGKNDIEIGSNRLTKREADERLAEFGLTANLVIEITKAVDEAQAAKTAAMKASGEIRTGGRNCDKLTTDEINAIYAKFAKADNSDDAEVKADTGKDVETSENVIEVKTFDSGRYTVKLNGKRISVEYFAERGYDNAPNDAVIILDGRKYRNRGSNTHGNAHYYNVFTDENGYGFPATTGHFSEALWSLGKGMTPIRDFSKELAEMAANKKGCYYRFKVESESKSYDEHINVFTHEKSVDVFSLLPDVDELNDVDTDETDEVKAEAIRKFADKLFRVERFSQKQVDTVVAAILDGQNADAVKKLIDDFKAENFNEAQKVAARLEEIIADEEAKADEVTETAEKAETAKFETGKTYAAKKSVLFDSQINMTVIKRTNCYVTIQFDEDEEDIRRCKIVDDAGVEKIYIHETNAISGDYEFSANDVAEETDIDEVKDDEPNRNMKLAAKIVNSLPGTLIFLGEGVTKNGKPTVSFDVENGTEISPMIRVTETFTDGTKSAIDYVEVTRDYAETKTAKHVRYYFADGGTDIDALTVLNDRVNDLLRRRDNVNANMRLLTNDEYAGKLAELDSELRYVEIQIGAIKAGDTFDYVDAAEHIKGVHEDVKTCIDLWTREHGLTVAQCEQIYVAAHVDRNFTADVDRELINRMIDDFKRCNAADTVKAEFDKAVTESVNNYSATVEINGETLTFEDGQLAEVASLRYEAYFTIRDGRRNFYYRGNRVSKQDFFGHIAVEDKAIAERAAITEFVAKYGGSEFKPGTNPLDNFVAQIHPTLANGRQDNYFATFDSKADAHAFIDEFKTLAGDMKFIATIKRGSFYGEEIYRHGLNGQEYFAPDDEAEVLNANWKDAQRQLDKRITVEIQGGGTCAIDKDSDIRLTKIKDGYAFVDYGKIVAVGAKVVLGRYDTPAQVKEVIDKFGKSIFGNRFEFPHVEDVSKSDIEIAEELTAFLLKTVPWHAGFMDLTLQNGNAAVASPRTATIKPDWHGNGRFAFVTPWNEIFARYDTASQVRTVIYRIKHAVEDKRDKFKYPTVVELTAPDYREKHWAVDFDIYHADSDLTGTELEDFTDRLREVLTANGNAACVELEDSVIAIYGDDGGDNAAVDKIVGEMLKRGCWVEYPEDAIDPIEQLARGIERMRELGALDSTIDSANEKARLC